MIPKIIHYCWLSGDSKPDTVVKCLDSWKQYLPDYQIKCWDANAFKSIDARFAKEAFEHKKWAFVSDYIRLFALYHEGGIYLDSDVQVWDNIDDMLSNEFFSGLETRDKEHTQIYLEAAIMGAERGNGFIKQCLDLYDSRRFVGENGELDMTPIPTILSPILEQYCGWKREDITQYLDNGVTVYSTDIIANTNCERTSTVKLYHLNNRSWIPLSAKEKFIRRLKDVGVYDLLRDIKGKR